MSQDQKKPDNRTATQRIEDLENVVATIYMGVMQNKTLNEVLGGFAPTRVDVDNLQHDVNLLKEIFKLLNKRIEAVIKVAAPETGINTKSVDDVVVAWNIAELSAQVSGWVASGDLIATDTVGQDSFLVVEEVKSDGIVAQPRLQFRLNTQAPETVSSLLGAKVGDLVSMGEGKLSLHILEVYTVVSKETDPGTPAPETAASEGQTETQASETQAQESTQASEAVAPPVLHDLPPESPVVEFVPSDASTLVKA